MKKYILFILLIINGTHLFAQKPNVVFILVDDMGYGDLGCYGQKRVETPNIDKIATGGIKFNQFYAGTSVCAPSRASFMTGLHTGHTPIRGNYEIMPEGQLPLPDSVTTIPELFKKAGYITGGFGKWGLGYPGSEGEPTKQGMDVFFGYNCQRQSHNYFPDHLWDNTQKIKLNNSASTQKEYAPDIIQKHALQFIEANKKKPFFLYLAYTLPHAALQLPEGDRAFQYYKTKFNEQPQHISSSWYGKGYQPQAYPHAAYAAMVSKIDSYVDEVLRSLRTKGLEQNTIVIFTSDNGAHIEGGNDPAYFNSSGGLKGVKRMLNEGGIRTPLIVSWPGKIKGGKVSNHLGAFWDFFPTFANLTGQKMNTATDGISMMPILLGKGQLKQHEFLYWEFHEDGGRQAVRIGKWKGIKEKVIGNANATIELYDLKTDPKESKNLALNYPAVIQKIEQIMKSEHQENNNFPFIK